MNKVIKDILRVFSSNIVTLILGILSGFILPKIMDVPNYGMYKTFTLYGAYVGLFQIGIVDGLYLKYGGYNYEDLEKDKFAEYCKSFFIVELVSSVVLLAISIIFVPSEYRFILICLSIYLLLINMTGFYQMISKMTLRFKELATRNNIYSIALMCVIGILFIFFNIFDRTISYHVYIGIVLLLYTVLLVWYAFTYKDISFKSNIKPFSNRRNYIEVIKSGIPMMVAYLCSSLILSLDRQFVNLLFEIKTYAVYSFAYSMLSLVTSALSAISSVMYPNLKRTDSETLSKRYSSLVMSLMIGSFGCLVVYFPLVWFVNWYLPAYSGSLVIFRIVLPGIVVSSIVTIVMQNYYIALERSFDFFKKTIIVLALSFIANIIAYLFFRTTYAISIASVIVTLFWYLIDERYFVDCFNIKWVKNFAYLLVMMLGFYLVTEFADWYIGIFIYILYYLVITVCFWRKNINQIIISLKERKSKLVCTRNQ